MVRISLILLLIFFNPCYADSSCIKGTVLNSIEQKGLTIFLCKSNIPNDKYEYWITGFEGQRKLSPIELKLRLKGRVTVK